MSQKLPITVVIPVLNEARNLARCLSQLERFSEIVVIDSGSTDRTVEIAEQTGALVLHFEWNGRYPKKRNWFLLNHAPGNSWVLFLDADEFVTDEFCDEIAEAIGRSDIDGFWLQYDNFFLGKRLKHGIPQRKLALFRFGRGLYERIAEENWSRLDMEVHEHPVIEGAVGSIRSRIEHNDFKGLHAFLHRHLEYASWEKQRYLDLASDQKRFESLTSRQRFKYRHVAKWWYPAFYFATTYLFKRGFLDGGAGLHYAYYKSWYFHTIRLMIRMENKGE